MQQWNSGFIRFHVLMVVWIYSNWNDPLSCRLAPLPNGNDMQSLLVRTRWITTVIALATLEDIA